DGGGRQALRRVAGGAEAAAERDRGGAHRAGRRAPRPRAVRTGGGRDRGGAGGGIADADRLPAGRQGRHALRPLRAAAPLVRRAAARGAERARGGGHVRLEVLLLLPAAAAPLLAPLALGRALGGGDRGLARGQ